MCLNEDAYKNRTECSVHTLGTRKKEIYPKQRFKLGRNLGVGTGRWRLNTEGLFQRKEIVGTKA
jgi:hypothetical protein